MRGEIREWTVIVIFVLIGLSLPTERILPSLARIQVHVFIQIFIFIAIPLIVAIVVTLVGTALLTYPVVVGLYAVAVLPTTGSSCAVFTEAAHGDVVIATANAAIANTLGIFLSPLLLSLLLGTQGEAMTAAHLMVVVQSLIAQMLIPIASGQFLRSVAREHVAPHGTQLRNWASAMIVLVVFLSASSALDAGFRDLLTPSMAAGFLILAILHLLMFPVLYRAGNWFGFSHRERVAVVFTGSQKTLAIGAPLLTIYFSDRPDLFATALVLLMFYHLIQLITGGFVRNWLLAIGS